ncbi:GNAT family N-acetyltransferase [Demequina sp.]|uniref:GNAT family N-acetyltransferase n=1 Tax=Demequina sp. TaxID=2050685 RepID=UPI0025BC8A7E|nr:GNAT family N-acetyltransferase [Demequina sp.]
MDVAQSVPSNLQVRPWSGEAELARLLSDYLVATEREKGSTIESPDDLPPQYRVDPPRLVTTLGTSAAFVAWQGADAVGCVLVTAPESGGCEIKRLWVDPACRGRGVAGALVAAALAAARAMGAQRAMLTVLRWRTGAIRLYERWGFEAVPSWDDRDDLLCMERLLEPPA